MSDSKQYPENLPMIIDDRDVLIPEVFILQAFKETSLWIGSKYCKMYKKRQVFYSFHSYIYSSSPKNHAFSLIQRIKPEKCFSNIPNTVYTIQYTVTL